MRHLLTGASLALTLVCASGVAVRGQAAPPAAPSSDLDVFMARVLARRDVNRQTLQQYILDDTETFEVLGPGRAPLHRGRREFSWYVRDGLHVRSPVRFDGVAVGEADRRKYEDDWIHQEHERLDRLTKRTADAAAADRLEPAGPPVGGETPVATPRFVSEAYFMDFKFEPGNYYLAGREQLEGHAVLRIEYYPTRMFNDDPDRDRKSDEKRREPAKPPSASERKQEEALNKKLNKTALVTLWVDPAEYQIVKYTFDNVWMDFLPGAWLVRVDDIHASMTMGQPFPGVWLPRQMDVHAGISLATGPFEATYARQFANYKLADVTSIIRVPKLEVQEVQEVHGVQGVHRVHAVQGVQAVHLVHPVQGFHPVQQVDPVQRAHSRAVSNEPDAPHERDEPAELHEPYEPHEPSEQQETVREIRVHGNAAVLDDDVIKLAGLTLGQALPDGALEAAEQRLKQSGKFESVEVRKRYRSLTDPGDVAIVLVVHERPGTFSAEGVIHRSTRPFGRVGERLMFLPILNYADGYGFTYGGRMSAQGMLGMGERLSVPLTWGGTRRAALEFDRPFKSGPLTRIESSVGIAQRENPHFRLDDRRVEVNGRAERQFARVLRTAVTASRSEIDFGGTDDRLWTLGADAAVDTRADPTFPRNAFLLGAGWTALHVRSAPARIDRYTTDARGYVGLFRQVVGAARVQYTAASAPLPDFERLLLGGASTLRGFRTGTFDGDRTLVTSTELRVPITSILSSARLGVIAFFDAGKAWNIGERVADVRWHRGTGGGVFLIAPLIKLNLDIAHGLTDGDTRVHFGVGFAF